MANIDPLSFKTPTPQYNTQGNITQQGHVALANLLARTLESIGQPTTSQTMIQGQKQEHWQSKNNNMAPSNNISNPKSPNSSLSWIRKRWKKDLSTEGEFPKPKSKSDENITSGNFNENASEPPATARLQLFGSEYARFLSTTPLAPTDVVLQGSKRNQRPPSSFRRRNTKESAQNIEEAEKSVLTGPITDIIVTQGDEQPPKGYYRLSQSSSGEPFLLREKKTTLYLCVKKETNWDRAAQRPCVTALTIIFPERKEFVPPGFSVVRMYSLGPSSSERPPANFNLGASGGGPAYLCFRRSREGNPITGILPLYPSRKENIPEGYTVLEHTPRNFVAHIQISNTPVFLAYRQRLANLELLRPLPLVMSVYNGGSNNRKLTSYYCTGGTVVDSRVGRFHIMDRSTHSLLSPSSINNRLSLIEASRRKTLDSIKDGTVPAGVKYSYSGSASIKSTPSNEAFNSSLVLTHTLGTPGSRSAMSESERLSSVGDYESVASSADLNRSLNQSYGTSHGVAETEHFNRNPPLNPSLYTNENKDLERCLVAMDFIPSISTGLNENDFMGMKSFRIRVAILTPVMTACYTRHGGSALIAVEGLSHLLRQGFFADDVNMPHTSPTQTTLLDIAVQVVSDVATMGAQETQLYACVEFVQQAVKLGCGYLSTRTVGYIIRFYLFVFYFGVSSPTGTNWGVLRASDKYILEDPRISITSILPGGAPQSAILSLKDMFVFLVARLGSLVYLDQCVVNREKTALKNRFGGPFQIFGMIDEVVNEVVDSSVHRVDVANLTQLAMHQIMRSGGSELFWYEMINSCGTGLFGNDTVLREESRHLYCVCFALLANCVKIASAKMRKIKKSEGLPRDTASKLMSLELLKFFLDTWEMGLAPQEVPGSRSLATFAFSVRRLVVPCLLTNTAECLDDPRVFRRIIQIVGTLWCSKFYRNHMKLEIGIMFDHFVLRILKLGPQILFKSRDDNDMTYLFAQQLELMKELKNWFSGDSDALLELFLNFDTEYGTHQVVGAKELLSGIQWRICEQLCSSLCILSEKTTEFLGEQIRESQSTSAVEILTKGENEKSQRYEGVSTITLSRESARRLRQGALDTISQIVKHLTQAAASSQGHKFEMVANAWENGERIVPENLGLQSYVGLSAVKGSFESSLETRDDESTVHSGEASTSVLRYWQRLGAIKRKIEDAKKSQNRSVDGERSTSSSVYTGHEESSLERRNTLKVAFGIAKDKSLSKAIDYLVACNVLTTSPRDIASFLRIHRSDISPSGLGRYLGEGGSDGSETEYWNLIRFNYIRAIIFAGMTVEEG
jgi:hypothetical protein